MRKHPLRPGDPAPWFVCRCTSNEDYHFSSVAGRYVVVCFFPSAAEADSAEILKGFFAGRSVFNDTDLCFFGVSADPDDERLARVAESLPGIRIFWDFDGAVGKAFGLTAAESGSRKITYVLDPRLRVMAAVPFGERPGDHAQRVLAFLGQLPALGAAAPAAAQAPVLTVPYVFEPALCRALIEAYERQGGGDSGFMRDRDGKTVGIVDYGVKRRRDCLVRDEELRRACMTRIHDRLAPEILKAFQFQVSRMERYIVSCYDAAEGGYFRAHRDNTTRGTAHRRFAVSLFLNTGEYEGGFLCFPEFGRQLYTAPVGGAVVFSCSLLHEATPVTRGRRYMFLPFLFDEAAAAKREEYLRSAGAIADEP